MIEQVIYWKGYIDDWKMIKISRLGIEKWEKRLNRIKAR